MATLTNLPSFTSGSDTRIDSSGGWEINSFTTINTFAGADTISGAGGSVGLQNQGALYASAGDDVISGTGSYCGIINIVSFIDKFSRFRYWNWQRFNPGDRRGLWHSQLRNNAHRSW
jgi:hypothetical protein